MWSPETRRRKTAAERRAQRARAESRFCARLLRIALPEHHRGFHAGSILVKLADALELLISNETADPPDAPQGREPGSGEVAAPAAAAPSPPQPQPPPHISEAIDAAFARSVSGSSWPPPSAGIPMQEAPAQASVQALLSLHRMYQQYSIPIGQGRVEAKLMHHYRRMVGPPIPPVSRGAG